MGAAAATTYRTEQIRNVALVGHSGAGTTSVAEALLVRAGALTRTGRSGDGPSLLDTEPESVKRRISLSLAVAPFTWTSEGGRTCKINVLDTPGHPDFVGEVEAAFAVADLVVVVVSAVDGVEVQTELLWRRAAELGLPRLVFVNKEDRERADFHRVLGQLREVFGAGFVPLELPLGEAGDLHGLADVLSESALEYQPGGTHRTTPLPAEVEAEEHALHEQIVEEIVSGDDDQLEHYLAGDTPSVDSLERTLSRELLDGFEFPVLLGSATTGLGIDRLADFLCDLGPSPLDRPVRVGAGDTEVDVIADAAGQPLLQVFATTSDPFTGQLSMVKVLSGTVRNDDHLVNTRTGADERLHGLVQLRGKDQTPTSELIAGDIGGIPKLSSSRAGDALAPKSMPVTLIATTPIVAAFGLAIAPRTQGDDDKLGNALTRLLADDPVLVLERNDATHQTVLRGVGDAHVAVALERLTRKYGVQVDTAEVLVAYKETAAGTAEAEGKVKKQTGGHGQYAVADLRISPLPRGTGFEFVDAVVGGAIPRNYLPAVERGIEEAMARGGVHGFPVVDVRVECFDGKFHPVDSSEMAFRAAAAHGFESALAAAGVTILEPISRLTVTAPAAHQGEVLSDIAARRGRVQHTETTASGEHEVVAVVPTSELARYAIDLRSMTGGRGRFRVEHSHDDVLPSTLVDRAKAGVDRAKAGAAR